MMNLETQNELFYEIHKQRYAYRRCARAGNKPEPTVVNHVLHKLGGLFITIGVLLTKYGDHQTVTPSSALVIEAK